MLVHQLIVEGFVSAWGAVVLVWIVGAFYAKRTASTLSKGRLLMQVLPFLILWLLVTAHLVPEPWLRIQLWPSTVGVQLAGLAATLLGCALAIWSRWTLGSNWSGIPNIKEGHELIVHGPYALVRHPIYTGALLAVLGTASASGVSGWFGLWLLVAALLTIKLRLEERLLLENFPEAYAAYRQRVKALIPWII